MSTKQLIGSVGIGRVLFVHGLDLEDYPVNGRIVGLTRDKIMVEIMDGSYQGMKFPYDRQKNTSTARFAQDSHLSDDFI